MENATNCQRATSKGTPCTKLARYPLRFADRTEWVCSQHRRQALRDGAEIELRGLEKSLNR